MTDEPLIGSTIPSSMLRRRAGRDAEKRTVVATRSIPRLRSGWLGLP
jgi:hypothetical protein